jgi:transcriptional regulator with XRE-family HTH domain
MMFFDVQAYGEKVREAREARNWNKKQLADATGIDSCTLTALERGERKMIQHRTRIMLDAVLGFDSPDADIDPLSKMEGPDRWVEEWRLEAKREMDAQKLSPNALAKAAGVSGAIVESMLISKREPKLRYAMAVSDALGITIEW